MLFANKHTYLSLKILVIIAIILGTSNALASDIDCANDKRAVAECYGVKGTLSMHANMRPYLKIKNNGRLLSISYKDNSSNADYFMPKEVADRIALDKNVVGDFNVCPFTMPKAHEMGVVCIESASHLTMQTKH